MPALSVAARGARLWAAALAALAACAAAEPERSVRPGANDRFLAGDLDVGRYVEIFEGESRELAARRDAIVAALALRPGMAVADVGAGTGLFVGPFARAVGAGGKVYAVDISPAFVEHLRSRAKQRGLDQVTARLGSDRSAQLPDASVDLVFLADTYHHFEYPRSMLASLRGALRPGGILVVVDFERVPGVSRDWILEHVRAGKGEFTREIEAAGFESLGEVAVEGLEENYLLRFRRP